MTGSREMPQGLSRRELLATTGGSGLGLAALAGGVAAEPPASRKPDTALGDHVLEFDLPGLAIGSAIYSEGPTGCTVFYFPERAQGVVDIRGGSPATFWTDALRRGIAPVDAICLTRGSIYGLESVSGVLAGLLSRPEFSTNWKRIALVSGAVIYDFGARKTSVYPDRELGTAALEAARPGRFPLGARGAGASASCGKWHEPLAARELAGQGGAFGQRGPVQVAVFTVANPVGAIVDRRGRVVRGHLDPQTGRRLKFTDTPKGKPGGNPEQGADEEMSQGNTTLTVLVTNQQLDGWELSQLARQVHSSMARAIQPFHSLIDGDVFYAVTTGKVKATGDKQGFRTVAEIADELAWDAVLSSFAGRD